MMFEPIVIVATMVWRGWTRSDAPKRTDYMPELACNDVGSAVQWQGCRIARAPYLGSAHATKLQTLPIMTTILCARPTAIHGIYPLRHSSMFHLHS